MKLIAKPELVDSTNFGLDDPKTNNRLAKNWLDNKVSDIKGIISNPNYILFRTGSWSKGGFIVLVNLLNMRVAYFVNYSPEIPPTLNTPAAVQVEVWRDDTDLEVVGITKKIFFDVLLKHFGSVMCDQEHTSDGRRFWRLVLAQADKLSKRIGYIENTTLTWKTPSESFRTWMDTHQQAWGSDSTYRGKRFIISN